MVFILVDDSLGGKRGLLWVGIQDYGWRMSYTGKVKNGLVVLPPDVHLPEGAEVRVEPLELLAENDAAIQAILKLAKPRPHWPKDFALNHAHYVKGHPKKS